MNPSPTEPTTPPLDHRHSAVLTPHSLEEACDLLARDPEHITPLSGGTDLLVNWPQNHDAHERTYLDLSALPDLKTHIWTEDNLTLGALTTYWDLIQDDRARTEFPILIAAARQIGAIQIQSRGTWAGNIANASPAADGVAALMACAATIILHSKSGPEEIPLDHYYLGYKKTRRRPDQLITHIRIPRQKYDKQVFEKIGARSAQAITKVGLALTHSHSDTDYSKEWRIVVNSMAPTVRRCPSIEQCFAENTPIHSPHDLLSAIRADLSPIDDIRSTASYRETVLARLLFFHLKHRPD